MEKFLIVYGNLIDGFTFVGPFDSYESAADYEEKCQGEASIATLCAPDRT